MKRKKALNLGAGRMLKQSTDEVEWVNHEYVNLPGIDVMWDCNVFPWKVFEENEFDEVYSSQVLEHLSDRIKVMEELWRITKPGGILKLDMPYFSHPGAFCHPEHKSFWGLTTFDYFDVDYHKRKGETEIVTPARFRTISKRIVFSNQKKFPFNLMNAVITPLININRFTALFYQRFLCWILPCEDIFVELEVIK